MKPFLQARAADIHEYLGPVLAEMGLRMRAVNGDGYPRIIFEQRNAKGRDKRATRPFSPVAIEFEPKSETGLSEARWIGAYVCLADWRFKELGNTGWRHRRLWETRRLMLRSFTNPAVHFAEMEGHIRELGIIALSERQPMIADSKELADAVLKIGSAIDDLAIVRFDDDPRSPTEAATFIDDEGQRIHLCFKDWRDGIVLIDGQKVGRFDATDPARVASLAKDLKRGRQPDERDVDEWTSGQGFRKR
jgi:hypothetical protein